MIVEKYTTGIEKYRIEGSEDEWYTSKLEDLAMEGTNSTDVFNAIDGIVKLATKELESDLFYNHIQFLITLARKANTTEPSKLLLSNYEVLQNKANQFGQPQITAVKELCKWFRLPFNN